MVCTQTHNAEWWFLYCMEWASYYGGHVNRGRCLFARDYDTVLANAIGWASR